MCGRTILINVLTCKVEQQISMLAAFKERPCACRFPTAGTSMYFKALGAECAECASAAAACAPGTRPTNASCRVAVAAPHPDPSPDLPDRRGHSVEACGAGPAHAADEARSARGGAAAASDRLGPGPRPSGAAAGAASAAAGAGRAAPGEGAAEAAGPSPGARRRAKRGRTGGGAQAAHACCTDRFATLHLIITFESQLSPGLTQRLYIMGIRGRMHGKHWTAHAPSKLSEFELGHAVLELSNQVQ